jgi:hypothetical protein
VTFVPTKNAGSPPPTKDGKGFDVVGGETPRPPIKPRVGKGFSYQSISWGPRQVDPDSAATISDGRCGGGE